MVRAAVLRARLSDRAICRSLAPPCFRRRISRTRRIDTLSAGIGPRSSFLTSRAPSTAQRSSACHPFPGWPASNRNGRDQIGISGRLHSGIGGRLPPEYAGHPPYLAGDPGSRPSGWWKLGWHLGGHTRRNCAAWIGSFSEQCCEQFEKLVRGERLLQKRETLRLCSFGNIVA